MTVLVRELHQTARQAPGPLVIIASQKARRLSIAKADWDREDPQEHMTPFEELDDLDIADAAIILAVGPHENDRRLRVLFGDGVLRDIIAEDENGDQKVLRIPCDLSQSTLSELQARVDRIKGT